MNQEINIFAKKLPGWMFVVAMFFAAVAVVLIAQGAFLIIDDMSRI